MHCSFHVLVIVVVFDRFGGVLVVVREFLCLVWSVVLDLLCLFFFFFATTVMYTLPLLAVFFFETAAEKVHEVTVFFFRDCCREGP